MCFLPPLQVAIKKIDKLKTRKAYVEVEVAVMRMARSHPNIVAIRCVFETPAFVYIVMELMEGKFKRAIHFWAC